MTRLDLDLMQEVIAVLLSSGGEYADIFFQDATANHLEAESGRVERVSVVRETGAGLRLIRGGVTHFASAVDLAPRQLLDLASDLASGAGAVGDRPGISLRPVTAGSLPPGEDPSAISLDEKSKLVMRAIGSLEGLDGRLVQVKSVYRDSSTLVRIANSDGISGEDLRRYGVFLVQVVASDGERFQVGYEPVGGIGGYGIFRELDPEKVAQTAAARALTMLDAREAPSGRMTVVLSSEAGGTMVHEAVGHGLEADLSGQGLSVYTGKLGEKVASSLVTVVDDPTLPGKRGSYNMDDEGTPGSKTILVEKGVLVNYMSDRLCALRDGLALTGNGRRQSFRHWPIPRMSNTIIEPGGQDPGDILKSVDYGLLVRKMGGGQVNTVTGDFVFEVSEGSMIRGGEVAEAVRGATLAGNGPEVLKSVDMVGNDLGFGIGTCGKEGQGVPVGDAQPTLRIPEIVVGGRDGGEISR
jgi:TldD protein